MDQVDVIIHPQSIIHSCVQFQDGSIKAQLGLPDMKLPIQYALGYPQRLPNSFERFDFLNYPQLTFEKPDLEAFRNLALAFESGKRGGNAPCILNAANEVAVSRFLADEISFLELTSVVEYAMNHVSWESRPDLQSLLSTDTESRMKAKEYVPSSR
jgi:1-deoxy-D-xylulose-5-phosphate reductoisomerase